MSTFTSKAVLWRRWRRAGLAAVLMVPLVLAALIGLLAHQVSAEQMIRAQIDNSYQLRARMQRVFALLLDAETSARGYVLTGRHEFLQPYEKSRNLLAYALADLSQANSQPRDLNYLSRLEALSQKKLAITAQIVALEEHFHHSDAEALVRSGQDNVVMGDIRALLQDWKNYKEREYQSRLDAASKAGQAREWVVVALAVTVVMLLMLAAAVALLAHRQGIATAAALAISRDEAQSANRAKSAFLAMMSHELRTPLNGILGMTHVLEKTALDVQQRSYLKIIEHSGQSLMTVLNDILDLSKVEAGKLEIEHAPFELGAELRSVIALWQPLAAEKGLDLKADLDPSVPDWARGDVTRLRQVLTNLLSNAVKFTEHGQILVGARHDRSRLVVEVADSGIGISEEAQARLFDDFSQADTSTTRRFGGTGLGLAISRRLCRLMRGDLICVSRPGAGTTFRATFELPADSEGESAVLAAEYIDIPTLKVLAVDDNPTNRLVVEAMLSAIGLSVSLAESGEQALEALRTGHFDAVLMDINMPGMNGIEALRQIRAGAAGPVGVPVIALTADAMAGDREKYIATGFDDHLAKPIVPRQLAETLARAAMAGRSAGLAA